MKISIVTVCYNSASTIRDTIESVLSQSYSNIEYIVVDGGSKDSTMAIVSEYGSKIAKIVSEQDGGIYDAMNKGIRMAGGDYVGILNSDDVFYDASSVECLVNFLLNDPLCDAAYADLVYVDRTDLDKITRRYTSQGFARWKVRFGIMIPHPTFYARKELFFRLGFYKLGYRVAADFELMARFMSAGIKVVRNPVVMVKMREGGISNTGFWWRVHQNLEIVRACRENKIYTNIFLIVMKIPVKLAGYIAR